MTTFLKVFCMNICAYIYIYIERERERYVMCPIYLLYIIYHKCLKYEVERLSLKSKA